MLTHPEYNFDHSWLGMGQQGLASVIIPTFNRRLFLNEALESILAQIYRPIEVIVVDDGSSDGTSALIEEWQQRHQGPEEIEIRYVWQTNRGAPVARNHGLVLSKGQYIQFLDADDVLMCHKLSDAIMAFNNDPDLDLVFAARGDFSHSPHNMRPWDRKHADLTRDPSPAEVVLTNVWTALPLFTRELLSKAGPWDERLRSLQDWEYIGRVAFWAQRARSIDKIQALCRAHEGPRLSVNPWGEPTGVQDNARASAALFPLVKACDSPRRAEALVALARRSLSCLRVAIGAGHLWLAHEIIENNQVLMAVQRKTRWESWLWRVLLLLPVDLLDVLFRPVRAVKRRHSHRQA